MRPELVNRIDKILVFRALSKPDIYKIIDLQMAELGERLQKQGLGIQLTTAAKQYLLSKGYDAHNGVRPLRRLIQDTIEDYIAQELLSERANKGDIIMVGTKQGELSYSAQAENATLNV